LGVESTALGAGDFTRIGYVSENQEQPGWMTVQYLLNYVAPFYPTWDDERANALVDLFDLPRDRKIRALSRGMKMKVALTSSLAYRPKFLVLDEPFSGLDPMMREDLVSGLAEAAEETTILISSHDLADMESFASHIGYLETGRLEFAEEMTSLMSRFREVEVVLDVRSRVPALDADSWPGQWIRPEATPTLTRFVDTRFDEAETRAMLARVFGDFAGVAFNPMPLRSIFVTLARNSSTRVH
jgi:ABC-2 type transport system ATP-binding protein